MEKEIIIGSTRNFESFVHYSEEEIEFWLSRDLQHLLGYGKWDNFKNVISKAQTACNLSGELISNHFVSVNKTVTIGTKTPKQI